MELICPKCSQPIDSGNINVMTDLAQCPHCGTLSRASELASGQVSMGPVRSEPPPGSLLQLTREMDGVRIFMPRRKFGCANFFMMGFSIFWLCFVAVWTWFASQASLPFALFSIPFWIVGAGMFFGSINNMFETQTLLVSRSRLILEKHKLIRSRRYEWTFREIQGIRMQGGNKSGIGVQSWSQRNGVNVQLPSIVTAEKTHFFFEGCNLVEQEWIVQYLQAKLNESHS